MGRLDDPGHRILRLFQMEQRERGSLDAKRYEDGVRPDGLPLDQGELVYGVFKDRYFFTPIALLIREGDRVERIPWGEVVGCSSRHGGGDLYSKLVLVNGVEHRLLLADFGRGWSGRISQLYHQLIERHGAAAALGPPAISVGHFFDQATDPYSFLPNIEPHPGLEEARLALEALAANPGVKGVWLPLLDSSGPMVVDSVVVVGDIHAEALESFGKRFGADGVIEADSNTRRKVDCASERSQVRVLVWD